MSRRWMVLLSSLGAALWLVLSGDRAPAEVVDAAAARHRQRESAASPTADAPFAPSAVPVLPRESLWPAQAARTPIDLFAVPEHARPAAPATAAPAVEPASPPAPTAPPLRFIYLGKHHDGSAWEVFLGLDDRTLIVKAGDLLEGPYRVDSIAPPVLVLVYEPLQARQTLAIGGVD
jgi:hypothetical protein